ncbi:hypothetical protein PENTCL1PPCAC_14977, partial [Pristionchus entomophagus]
FVQLIMGDKSEAATNAGGEGTAKYVVVKFIDSETSNEVHFRLGLGTRMGRAKEEYAKRTKVPVNYLRFLFDGLSVNDGDTPTSLKMEDDDVVNVDVVKCDANAGGDEYAEHFKLKFVGQDSLKGKTLLFILKNMKVSMGELKQDYADKIRVDVRTLGFLFHGCRINNSDSPAKLQIEKYDVVHVYQQQNITGGNGATSPNSNSRGRNDKIINLMFIDKDSWNSATNHLTRVTCYPVKYGSRLRGVKKRFADSLAADAKSLRFLRDGCRVGDDETPRRKKYEDEEVITVSRVTCFLCETCEI